ncbi:hypothetical protein BD324DRAFT_610692 [Kockovaella imperatae]|uniref:Uncharacterized protein n=1 Tax=Kockovaella imperatae TaxID=4999 RepID=A0A1Y1U737_9TREE|nr:hypothetical protein BD324DRAFT_610692 [Kockovaella imperatae]ORX33336.1 hypothetical protein BD324DRAFT_610692 [Kockovaella imperatae]
MWSSLIRCYRKDLVLLRPSSSSSSSLRYHSRIPTCHLALALSLLDLEMSGPNKLLEVRLMTRNTKESSAGASKSREGSVLSNDPKPARKKQRTAVKSKVDNIRAVVERNPDNYRKLEPKDACSTCGDRYECHIFVPATSSKISCVGCGGQASCSLQTNATRGVIIGLSHFQKALTALEALEKELEEAKDDDDDGDKDERMDTDDLQMITEMIKNYKAWLKAYTSD